MNAAVSQGVRVDHDTETYLQSSARVRPLRDWICIEVLDWRPSSYLEVMYFGKPLRGRVLVIGPGRYPIKYNGPKGLRTESWESGEREPAVFVPITVKVGEIIELGGLELRGYLFTSFYWGPRKCLMVREADVAIVYDD